MSSYDERITSKTETTFQYDKDLLTLPVPDLSNTINKYVESVCPLVTEEEYKQTAALAQEFLNGEEAQYLQSKLQAKGKTERNWLAKWWDDVAYLESRTPAPKLNMAGPGPYGEDVYKRKMGTQMERAAMTMYYGLKVWDYVRREQYKPMKDGKGRPQCMLQFRRVFNTCRIPGIQRDTLKTYFRTDAEGSCPKHVTVMSKGHIFVMDVLDESGELLTPPEIQMQLQRVRDRSKSLGPPQGVTYLTALERTSWAQCRSKLMLAHPQNYHVLEKIQSSIISYWLEDGEGVDLNTLTNKSLLGSAENRWLDKSLSIGMYEDGLSICNGDHTPAEGMLMVYITTYVHAKLLECNGEWEGTKEIRNLPEPELLSFVLDDQIKRDVEFAKKEYEELMKCATAEIRIYNNYGKKYLKKKKCHPDAPCQLAFHLAYYRLYGRMAPAYETAPTKQFYHGRTETLRSCTNEMKAWCEAMENPNSTQMERFKLFVKAIQKHNYEMTEACEGRGIDRHLLGLYMVAREEGRPIPSLFMDPVFYKSGGGGNYILSTSCIGFSSCLGGVLPMCDNGFGIFYRINDDRLTFYITSWNADADTSSKGFADAVCSVLDDMKILMDYGSEMMTARL